MLRLYVDAPPAAGRVRIAGGELHHLQTLRLGAGDRIVVFDRDGAEHVVALTAVGAHAAEGIVVSTRRVPRESPLDLVLAPALLKGRKLDLVVEKATELGVRRIAPFTCRHAIGQGRPVERWRRIALAAAKQSGRTGVPAVDAPVPFAALVAAAWPGLRLLAWEDEDAHRFADLPPVAAAAVIVVGPEGGFAPDEVAAARSAGFVTVTLGPRVLRGETAGIVAPTLCQQRWGDG